LKVKPPYIGILLFGLGNLLPITLLAQGAESVTGLEDFLLKWLLLLLVTLSLTVASFIRRNGILNLITFLAGAVNIIVALTAAEFSLFSAINAGVGLAAWISVIYIRRKQPENL
jgi:hypothetical protein